MKKIDIVKLQLDKMAEAMAKSYDFECWWAMQTEFTDKAEEMNIRGERQLSIYDKRTIGGKYLTKKYNELRKSI